jgi:hypothetical protein
MKMQELIEFVRENTRMRIALEMIKDNIDNDPRYYMGSEDVMKQAMKIAGFPLKEKDPTAAKQ